MVKHCIGTFSAPFWRKVLTRILKANACRRCGSAGLQQYHRVELKPHVHENHEQIYYIIKGSGTISVGEEKAKVKEGDCIYLPTDTPHGFINDGKEEVEIFCVGANIFRPWMSKSVREKLKKAEQTK
jgi:mannose-6-phosphate isomerase-like protein (cupin superfamily)